MEIEATQGAESRSRETMPAKLAKLAIFEAIKQYTIAGDHFKSVGAQSYNTEYGGSRSAVLFQMIRQATTLPEVLQARRDYHDSFSDDGYVNDEKGGLLRIAGYRLRRVPTVGSWLEAKVKADDAIMAGADFTAPKGVRRDIRTSQEFMAVMRGGEPTPNLVDFAEGEAAETSDHNVFA